MKRERQWCSRLYYASKRYYSYYSQPLCFVLKFTRYQLMKPELNSWRARKTLEINPNGLTSNKYSDIKKLGHGSWDGFNISTASSYPTVFLSHSWFILNDWVINIESFREFFEPSISSNSIYKILKSHFIFLNKVNITVHLLTMFKLAYN